jgi:hypothetical protein
MTYVRNQILLQLVRRATSIESIERQPLIAQNATARESFLSIALTTVLSVNIFMLAGVVSFCTFVYWYPS